MWLQNWQTPSDTWYQNHRKRQWISWRGFKTSVLFSIKGPSGIASSGGGASSFHSSVPPVTATNKESPQRSRSRHHVKHLKTNEWGAHLKALCRVEWITISASVPSTQPNSPHCRHPWQQRNRNINSYSLNPTLNRQAWWVVQEEQRERLFDQYAARAALSRLRGLNL